MAGPLVILLVPLLVSACITVTQQPDPNARITPSPVASVAAPQPEPVARGAAHAQPEPEPTRPPLPAPSEVVGFLPSWLLDDAAETLDPDLLTIVALHGMEASADGRLVSAKPGGDVPDGWAALGSDAFTTLKERLQADGVRVVLVIQRFGWSRTIWWHARAHC